MSFTFFFNHYRSKTQNLKVLKKGGSYLAEQFRQIAHYLAEHLIPKNDILFNEKFLTLWMQECKYASIRVCKYTIMQVCEYVGIKVCKIINMKVSKYASTIVRFKVCKFPSMVFEWFEGKLPISSWRQVKSGQIKSGQVKSEKVKSEKVKSKKVNPR